MTLYTYTAKDLTLAASVEKFCKKMAGDVKSYALLYAPRYCQLAIVESSNAAFQISVVEKREPNKLETMVFDETDVFEARIFNSRAELRWLQEADGKGRASVISEDGALSVFDVEPSEESITESYPQQYVVWGKSTDAPEIKGWTQFATARIGALEVPVSNVGKRGAACFTALEYFKEYEDGNVGVCDERLTGIQVLAAKPSEVQNNG